MNPIQLFNVAVNHAQEVDQLKEKLGAYNSVEKSKYIDDYLNNQTRSGAIFYHQFNMNFHNPNHSINIKLNSGEDSELDSDNEDSELDN